eukprot:GILJ01010617.1.p1 GENE.GILJ01010617.1~~GILJ01010617.1.p1  ORF type:complete len:845 (-),score=130.47 GILJ01010617.1:81-2300(-)
MTEELLQESVISCDVEQHHQHSFQGFVCLLQLSSAKKDYIVDTLVLRGLVRRYLVRVFENASILKVMHGADQDILWLQRDFSLFVTNLFDSSQAARELGRPNLSLAVLFREFCGFDMSIEVKKAFQRSDWRKRPLPFEMLQYARADSHYLLPLYYALIHEVATVKGELGVSNVWNRCKAICIKRYRKEPFDPRGYVGPLQRLLVYYDPATTPKVETLFAVLFEWRDRTARGIDESLDIVCSNEALLEIATVKPGTKSELFEIFRGAGVAVPYPVERFADDILSLVEECSKGTGLVELNQNTFAPIISKRKSRKSGRSAETETDSQMTDETMDADMTSVDNIPEVAKRMYIQNLREGKRNKPVNKYVSLVKRFAAKGPVYENSRMLAPDGKLLCHCDHRKCEWYVKKGIAEWVNENNGSEEITTETSEKDPNFSNPRTIRLLFEPSARGRHEDDAFYMSRKENQCVVCGAKDNFLRYHIVPTAYRQHFPEQLKSHRSHDVVLLCVFCHEKSNRFSDSLKKQLAVEFGVPLTGSEDAQKEMKERAVLKRAATALIEYGNKMPKERYESLAQTIVQFVQTHAELIDELRASSLTEQRQKSKRKPLKPEIDPSSFVQPDAETKVTYELVHVCSRVDMSTLTSQSRQLHGELVVQKVSDFGSFIRRWRVHFVQSMQPKYLPPKWDVDHEISRHFGEHSRFKADPMPSNRSYSSSLGEEGDLEEPLHNDVLDDSIFDSTVHLPSD